LTIDASRFHDLTMMSLSKLDISGKDPLQVADIVCDNYQIIFGHLQKKFGDDKPQAKALGKKPPGL